jgi:hypothetical protein
MAAWSDVLILEHKLISSLNQLIMWNCQSGVVKLNHVHLQFLLCTSQRASRRGWGRGGLQHGRPTFAQEVGLLCASRQIFCHSPSGFRHGGSAAPATHALTVGNSSWVRAMPLSAEANGYSPICMNVASLSSMTQKRSLSLVEVRIAICQCKIGYEIKCIYHTFNS